MNPPDSFATNRPLYHYYPLKPALHVSFDTKLACSFLHIGVIDYAEINLFTVNLVHFCIILFLYCKCVLSIHFASKHYYPVFSPFSCPASFKCGILPVSVDKCWHVLTCVDEYKCAEIQQYDCHMPCSLDTLRYSSKLYIFYRVSKKQRNDVC